MRQLIFLIFLVVAPIVNSQDSGNSAGMTQRHLHELIQEVGTEVVVAGNIVQFVFDGADMLCISDVAADRMRIISPIVEITTVDREQLLLALMANFHSALDVRYAISDGVVYAAFIHPLSPLSDGEAVSAISQVARARNTFGKEYTSGELYFGGGTAQ